MKVFIIYAGVKDELRGWPDNRSLSLQRVAGSNVLGHLLNQMRGVHLDGLVLAVDKDKEAIEAWIANKIPEIEVDVIAIAPGSSQLQALAECRKHFDKGPLLVVPGNIIVEADYRSLDQSVADVILFTRPQQQAISVAADAQEEAGPPWAVCSYFRRETDLRAALDRAPAEAMSFSSLLNDLQNRDLHVEKRPAMICLNTSTIDGLLLANARLLGLGYGSDDAIERSYVEDFTVIPPVFLHETAVIENAVVGPFANIEAGARIGNSVISNSLIGAESTIENAVLDGSLVGSRAHVQDSGTALIVEDDRKLLL